MTIENLRSIIDAVPEHIVRIALKNAYDCAHAIAEADDTDTAHDLGDEEHAEIVRHTGGLLLESIEEDLATCLRTEERLNLKITRATERQLRFALNSVVQEIDSWKHFLDTGVEDERFASGLNAAYEGMLEKLEKALS